MIDKGIFVQLTKGFGAPNLNCIKLLLSVHEQ